MFNRYWRGYPWLMQLLLLGLLVFTLSSFFTYLLLSVLPKTSGLASSEFISLGPDSSLKAIKTGLLAQIISHLGMFSLPALLYAIFSHPRIVEYLGLRMPKNPLHLLFSAGIILGLLPVFLWGEAWMMRHLHFGAWAQEMQKTNDNTILAFLKLRGTGMLAVLIIALALLPAVGEELLFRGILLRLVHRRTYGNREENLNITPQESQRKMIYPVAFTAMLFALIHFNPYGFVFIFVAGCMLALIYFLTGSLLCSMWAHFIYNGVQVVLSMQSEQKPSGPAAIEMPSMIFVLSGLIVFLACFCALIKTQRPLSPDWSQDYLPNEQ